MFSLICAQRNGWVNNWKRRWFETPLRSLWRHCYVISLGAECALNITICLWPDGNTVSAVSEVAAIFLCLPWLPCNHSLSKWISTAVTRPLLCCDMYSMCDTRGCFTRFDELPNEFSLGWNFEHGVFMMTHPQNDLRYKFEDVSTACSHVFRQKIFRYLFWLIP